MELYPVFKFTVDNWGYGEKATLFIVATDYDQAYNHLESLDRNIDIDSSDSYMAGTGYFASASKEHLPYVDDEI